MHQQFYYQLRTNSQGAARGQAHPLIAVDHSKPQAYPLSDTVPAANQQELDAWVVQQLRTSSLEPTTHAHLEVAHTYPELRPAASDLAQWSLYAEAFLRQQKHRALIGDRPEQLDAWRQWLQDQPFDPAQVPEIARAYFAQCTNGRDALALMQQGPGIEWNTAFMVMLNPSCKVDPAGKSHESGALQPRAMANKGHYGWTLSYSVTHLDYSEIYTPGPQEDDEGNPLDLGLDVKEATAHKMSSMAQKDEHGNWKDRPTTVSENASAWLDRMLLTMRHNKDVKRDVLEHVVATAIAAGIPQTQMIKNELPRTQLQGSSMSKALLEVVTGQSWERIGQQINVLEGLGYKEELPLYLWLYFKKAPQESYELPSLS